MPIDPLDRSVTEALHAWQVQLAAGVAASSALATAARVCQPAAAQRAFEAAAARADAGTSPEELIEALRPVLGEAERAILATGWKSGRAETLLEGIVAQRELWARTRSQVRARLLLPAAVLLIACFVAPLPRLLQSGALIEYILSACLPPLVAALLWIVAERLLARPDAWRSGHVPAFDRIVLSLPLAGGVVQARNRSLFASILAQTLSAGMLLQEALALCARALPNGVFREEARRLADHVRTGQPLSSGLGSGHLWPEEFVVAVVIGEKAGALDETLARAAAQGRENYERAAGRLAEWLPRILYALVALFVIYQIFVLLAGSLAPFYQGFGA